MALFISAKSTAKLSSQISRAVMTHGKLRFALLPETEAEWLIPVPWNFLSIEIVKLKLNALIDKLSNCKRKRLRSGFGWTALSNVISSKNRWLITTWQGLLGSKHWQTKLRFFASGISLRLTVLIVK